MSEKRFTLEESENQLIIFDNGVSDETYFHLGNDERDVKYVCDLLNEQQATIEKQKRTIKSQDMEISRQYNLCLAMSGVLREEFGVYDVFDRSKDKRVKMMSEKRFQMGRRIDVVSDIYDSQKDKLLILSDVVDCLNEQQATISQLREENEQLKEELNNLKKDETMLYYYYTLTRYGGE